MRYLVMLFDLFESEKEEYGIRWNLVEFCRKNCNFQPIPNLYFQIRWNVIITSNKTIKTKQNHCQRLAEQTVPTIANVIFGNIVQGLVRHELSKSMTNTFRTLFTAYEFVIG